MAANIDPQSPADKAGVRDGDAIVSFAGESIRGIDDLHRLLSADRVGKPLPLVVFRAGLSVGLNGYA